VLYPENNVKMPGVFKGLRQKTADAPAAGENPIHFAGLFGTAEKAAEEPRRALLQGGADKLRHRTALGAAPLVCKGAVFDFPFPGRPPFPRTSFETDSALLSS
jgi:hypothetical protein